LLIRGSFPVADVLSLGNVSFSFDLLFFLCKSFLIGHVSSINRLAQGRLRVFVFVFFVCVFFLFFFERAFLEICFVIFIVMIFCVRCYLYCW
jgi:hypothetical protein